VQREAGYVRTGSHVARVEGKESGRWHEADLIVASWYQHTSRDGDMQLHHHNQIAHVAITRHDGKGRAPDSTAYYEHVRAAGQVASVHAEAALTRRFGMKWIPRPDGMGFGIDGIGADLTAVFSHRRAEITELMKCEVMGAPPGTRTPNPRIKSGLLGRAVRSACTNVSGICPECTQCTEVRPVVVPRAVPRHPKPGPGDLSQ
jgi:hypothetical protein